VSDSRSQSLNRLHGLLVGVGGDNYKKGGREGGGRGEERKGKREEREKEEEERWRRTWTKYFALYHSY